MQNVQQVRISSSIRRRVAPALLAAAAGLTLVSSSAGASAFLFPPGGDERFAPDPMLVTGSIRADKPRIARPAPVAPKKALPNDLIAKAKGPLLIAVSIDKQQLTLYANGEPIATSAVSTGMRGHATPTGVFSIIQKDRFHRSNLYDDAPMPYMQRITWSGVALHQGVIPGYPASHGCVRLPEAFARKLWDVTRLGARVVIAKGEVTPATIAHAKLFTPKKPDEIPMAALLSVDVAKTIRIASAETGIATDALAPSDVAANPAPVVNPRPLKPGPVSVFISRKEGKIFVRKGFQPLFNAPITIERADQPFGTHVFTALPVEGDDANVSWMVVSMPGVKQTDQPAAGATLDRITLPQDVVTRISELVTPGASLVISDQGLGPETGIGTDFVVLTK